MGKLAGQKKLLAMRRVPLIYIYGRYGVAKAQGDIASELEDPAVRIENSSRSDGHYRVNFSQLMGGDTILEINGAGPLRDSRVPGELIYWKSFDIIDVDTGSGKVTVDIGGGTAPEPGHEVTLVDAAGNKTIYFVGSVILAGTVVEFTLVEHVLEVRDSLFPIHLDQDCEACQQEDTYSCVATVVLPYWPGRFPNMEMRRFTERTLRQEAPAHILLNICWLSCSHMHELEQKYKKWLLEISRGEPNLYSQSIALRELIETLTKARNVYPHGKLHDCESDDSYEGAVLLNQTFLGTF